jgi:hypothetical protein
MSKYERQPVDVGSLHDGDTFELPTRPDTICRVSHTSLKSEEDGATFHIIGYDIIDGPLHWPVIYCPPGSKVMLLVPTTTYVRMSGKDWVESLTEHHGVKE